MLKFAQSPIVKTYRVRDTGLIPNSRLPVLQYVQAFEFESEVSERPLDDLKKEIEERISPNRWYCDWIERDAIYRSLHYHSTAHEVLIVLDESAKIMLGDNDGRIIFTQPGDLLAIPAGVAHRRMSGNKHFTVAGIYPLGQSWDLLKKNPRDYRRAKMNLQNVHLPAADPFWGVNGPLVRHWMS